MPSFEETRPGITYYVGCKASLACLNVHIHQPQTLKCSLQSSDLHMVMFLFPSPVLTELGLYSVYIQRSAFGARLSVFKSGSIACYLCVK